MSQLSDLTFLKTFTAGDSVKMSKYINMFLSAAPQSLVQMKQQIEASDWKALKTAAHSLKTQLKYMGIASAVETAYAIEQNCGEMKDLDKIPDLMKNLDESTLTAISELQEALGKLWKLKVILYHCTHYQLQHS